MGTNSSKYDKHGRYKEMPMSELEKLRDFWLNILLTPRVRPYEVATEELALIRMYIAERIGKRKETHA